MSYAYKRKTPLKTSEWLNLAIQRLEPSTTYSDPTYYTGNPLLEIKKALSVAKSTHKKPVVNPAIFWDLCVAASYVGRCCINQDSPKAYVKAMEALTPFYQN